MILRGGGCGGSKNENKKQMDYRQRGLQTTGPLNRNEQPKFASKIQQQVQIIQKFAKLAESEAGKLNTSFQFFFDNGRELWKVKGEDKINQLFEVIYTSMNPLLQALESLIIGHPYFAVKLAQIISSLSWILFQFYLDSKRFMPDEDQKKFLKKIQKIEEIVEIEKNAKQYQNNLQFEIFIFKSIIIICPNDGSEGIEILAQFLAGAGEAVATFKLNDNFIKGLQKGVIFLYKEHEKASCKRLLKIIFSLIDLKFSTIEEIENSKDGKVGGTKFDYLSKLSTIYDTVVSKSSDWQVQCAWIQTLSQIFQHKLIIPAAKLRNLIEMDSPYLHMLSEETYWLNIDSMAIEKDPKAKLLYENLANLQELGRFQYLVLNGYLQMPGFEQLYFSKLTSQTESQNYNQFDFTLNTVSLMLHQAQQCQASLSKIQQQITLLNVNNLLKLNDIDLDIQKAINCNIFLLESIQGLNEYENKLTEYYSLNQQFQIALKEKKKESSGPPWYQEDIQLKKKMCEEFVQFYIKIQQLAKDDQSKKYTFNHNQEFKFIQSKDNNNSSHSSPHQRSEQNQAASPNRPEQQNQAQNDQIIEQDESDKLNVAEFLETIQQKKQKREKQKLPPYDQIISDLQTKVEPELLLQLQQKLKFIRIQKSKFYRSEDENFLEGFDQGVKFLKQTQSFIKWNLRILMFLKFHIKDILLGQNSKNQLEENILAVRQASQQLSHQKSVINSIKYFYKMFQACEKFNVIKNKLGQKNVIYNVLHVITVRKFKTQSLLMQIYSELIKKIYDQDAVYISQQIFNQIQLDIEANIQEIQQLNRATTMVNDLIVSRSQKASIDSEEFDILYNQKYFEINFEIPVDQSKWSANRDNQLKLQQVLFLYTKALKLMQNKFKNQDTQILEKKQKSIQSVLETVETLQTYQTITSEDEAVLNELVDWINNEMKLIQDMIIVLPNLNQTQNFEELFQQSTKALGQKPLFQQLKEFLQESEHSLIVNLENLRFINKPQGTFLQLIRNTLILEQNSNVSKLFEVTISNNKKKIKQYIEEYQKILPTQFVQVKQLEDQLRQAKFEFSSSLQSEIYFILTQIGKKEDTTADPSYYDQFKEVANDLLTKNKWRIRQFCIFELCTFRNGCLSLETLNQCNALFVKYKIYETDPRNQLLLNDQTQESLIKMISQCWSSQEEDVQNKIKEKLEELNDIAYKITIETKPYEKNKLKKHYIELEKEIQGIIKNAEGLGSYIGTSVLFFQDLKRDLVNVQAQLTNLQSSIDTVSKDIQYLKGRTVKDLLIMRMQRVLQQRLIINSESVYIQITTKERFVIEGYEDDETPLLTDDLFGDGEINEFIWKQQKLSFLIHGKAGSGKSTAARKIEEFLWLLYKKNMNVPESIPIIPIFISLPQLKDPQNLAMEETLKSDNYRFSEKQVIEFIEAVENNEFKLVIIMDSYDELNSQFIGCNLNQSNKLFKWRSSNDKQRFPKVITTSRSEIFTNNDYRTWFLSESENLRYYKEVQLQNFSQKQVQQFIHQHSILNVKKVIKEFYFNQKDNQGFFAFEELFEGILEIINTNPPNDQSSFLLSQDTIFKILDKCNLEIQDDEAVKIQQQLSEIWSLQNFQKLIQEMDIDALLETPFMIEIVTQVLPQMIKQRQDIYNLKDQFIKRFQLDINSRETNKSALEMWQRIINNDEFMKGFSTCFKDTELMDHISKHFSDLNKQNDKLDLLKKSLRLDPLCSFDFYQQFFQQYFKKQINKLREAGEAMLYVQNDSELWEFTHRLANEMTLNNLTQVKFQPKGLIFKKQKEDWRDTFFNDDCDQGPVKIQFRRVMPLRQKFGIFSFQHKSLQEFLVAKWFIQFLDRYDDFSTLEIFKQDQDLDIDREIILNVSFCSDFMKGIVKFIVDKVKFDEIMQEKLESVVSLSALFGQGKPMQQSVHALDNSLKNSMQYSQRQSQIIRKNSKISQRDHYEELVIKASSNCLYLLHLMKFKFQNLQHIKIQDIDLIGANFYEADLSHSHFTGVNLSKSNFNATILDYIIWDNILIDELPYIETKQQDPQIFYFSEIDGKIVYKSEYDDLICYNYKTGDKGDCDQLQILQKYGQKIQSLKNIVFNQNNDHVILIFEELEIIIINLNEKINNDMKFKIDPTNIEYDDQCVFDEKSIGLSRNRKHLAFISQNNLYLISLENLQDNLLDQPLEPELISKGDCWQILWLSDNELILLKYDTVFLIDVATQVTLRVINCEKIEIASYNCIEVGLKKFLLCFSYQSQATNASIIKILDQKNQILKVPEEQVDNLKRDSEQFYKEGYEIALEEQSEEIQLLKFVESEKYLLSFSLLKQKVIMRLWNFREKKLISSNIIDSNKVFKPLILPNSLISTVNKQGKIQIWDLSVCFLQQNEKISITITSVIFAFNFLISGNNKGIIQIWDEEKGSQAGSDLKEHKASITCLSSYSEMENQNEKARLISCDVKGYLIIWNLIKQEIYKRFFLISAIEAIARIKNKASFVTLSKTHYLQIWDNNFSEYKFLVKSKNINFQFNNPSSMLKDCQQEIKIDDDLSYFIISQNIAKAIKCFAYGSETEQLFVAYKNQNQKTYLSIYEEEIRGMTNKQIYIDTEYDVTIIKEITVTSVLIVANTEIFILNQKQIIKVNYQNQGQTINDAIIDQDLLLICSNEEISIINLQTNKIVIKQRFDEFQENFQLLKVALHRQNNILFIGTSAGSLIEYDMLTKKPQLKQTHTQAIISLKILKQKNYLLTCGKDKKIVIWSLALQSKDYLNPIREFVYKQQINEIWYDEVCKYFFITSFSNNEKLELNCLVWDFEQENSQQIYCFVQDIQNNQFVSFVERRQQIYITPVEKKKNDQNTFNIHKVYLLQEQLKKQIYIQHEFIPDMMHYCQGMIVTADYNGNIFCWNEEGDMLDINLKLGDSDQSIIERFVFDYSEIQNKLVFFYLVKDEGLLRYIIKIFSLDDQIVKLEKDFEIKDDQDGAFVGSKINSVNFLNLDLLLITFINYEYESLIISIPKKSIVDKINDHLGQLEGSISKESESRQEKGFFITYGQYNQISYYRYVDEFSEKFRLGDSIKKFSCKNAKVENPQVKSKHDINMARLFGKKIEQQPLDTIKEIDDQQPKKKQNDDEESFKLVKV